MTNNILKEVGNKLQRRYAVNDFEKNSTQIQGSTPNLENPNSNCSRGTSNIFLIFQIGS